MMMMMCMICLLRTFHMSYLRDPVECVLRIPVPSGWLGTLHKERHWLFHEPSWNYPHEAWRSWSWAKRKTEKERNAEKRPEWFQRKGQNDFKGKRPEWFQRKRSEIFSGKKLEIFSVKEVQWRWEKPPRSSWPPRFAPPRWLCSPGSRPISAGNAPRNSRSRCWWSAAGPRVCGSSPPVHLGCVWRAFSFAPWELPSLAAPLSTPNRKKKMAKWKLFPQKKVTFYNVRASKVILTASQFRLPRSDSSLQV